MMMYQALFFFGFLLFLLSWYFLSQEGPKTSQETQRLEIARLFEAVEQERHRYDRRQEQNEAHMMGFLRDFVSQSQARDKEAIEAFTKILQGKYGTTNEEELPHEVTPDEIEGAKIARKKLERCFGLANSLLAIPRGAPPSELASLQELQKLLGEVLLTGGEQEEIDAVYEGRFPGSVAGKFCSDCGKPGTPAHPLEEINRPDGEHRLVHKTCEEAEASADEGLEDDLKALRDVVFIGMGIESFKPKEVKRFAVKLEAPFCLVAVAVAPFAGMWLLSIEVGNSVLPLGRDIPMADEGGIFSLATLGPLKTYPAGTIIKATFTNKSDEVKTVAAKLQGTKGAQ